MHLRYTHTTNFLIGTASKFQPSPKFHPSLQISTFPPNFNLPSKFQNSPSNLKIPSKSQTSSPPHFVFTTSPMQESEDPLSALITEGEDPLSALVTLVIENYQRYSRGPYRVKDALQKAKQADGSSVERILVEKSPTAWYAYIAAHKTKTLDRGPEGRVELSRLLDHLGNQPMHRQHEFVNQLAAAMESIDANTSPQSAKRRRIATEDNTVAPVQPTSITRNADTCLTNVEPSVTEQIPALVTSRDVYVGAPLEPAEELFHDQFWDSVERTQSKEQPGVLLADISMIFQEGYIREHFGCQMEIGIAKEKVADLAFQYFGVKLEDKDGVRSNNRLNARLRVREKLIVVFVNVERLRFE
ncbi:uncharacterized protein FOBCDRAFT_240538 [Fusarium oxysporum Fo47]|uniref:uncharacterized protein n=1 Tax=Fusarium oxysporum Fo47 TaxID=660027 RepID=UPI00286997D3|nr:uncharacterized protein FOBCDRAFT_240538 [Fusarium oxysporum Fo47]QKD55298.2 hypothetical protein FOBCDRAFT_240538 [Fusarium oxysporum Fo47]